MVNGVRQLQALIDKKKMFITESSIRSDLHLEDAEGTDCLPTTTIFKELAKMGSGVRIRLHPSDSNHKYLLCLNHLHHLNPSRNNICVHTKRKQRKGSKSCHDEIKHGRKVYPTFNDPLLVAAGLACNVNDSDGFIRQDDDLMFDTGVLDDDDEVFVDVTTGEKDEQSTKIDDSTTGEAVTTAGVEAKPKAKGIVFHDQEEHVSVSKPTFSVTQPSIKDKGKAMMEADRLLAERIQTRERGELTYEEKGKLFMEIHGKEGKHFDAFKSNKKEKQTLPYQAQKEKVKCSTYLSTWEDTNTIQLMDKRL
ncbi:hypothetical protein Tco_1045193 [Tanacetum coccineum]|uniref:Uncharacterized protein n=2 Tax=Tanacetum coccineum TaxID=301880 RepID=A0ABQ5GSK5_9ASTR